MQMCFDYRSKWDSKPVLGSLCSQIIGAYIRLYQKTPSQCQRRIGNATELQRQSNDATLVWRLANAKTVQEENHSCYYKSTNFINYNSLLHVENLTILDVFENQLFSNVNHVFLEPKKYIDVMPRVNVLSSPFFLSSRIPAEPSKPGYDFRAHNATSR